ncbi:MAG: DJ-1/PfpI family protein [Chloroflexota bacterium]|jgi:putative intracellular protease/amidase
MTRPNILIPLPNHDFDPSESAFPWKAFTERGWQVTFATPDGKAAACDPRLLKGPLLGPLGAGPRGLANYKKMANSPEFKSPILYSEINVDDFDAVSLTGGHAPGMKQYLENATLQAKMVEFFRQGKVVGAICHGTLVLARAIDPATGKSVLWDYQVTALTKDLEFSGYALTFWLLGRRYRTYECYVADEVRGVLKDPKNFKTGPLMVWPFVVQDRNLLTSRWPLDAPLYARRLVEMVEARRAI